MNTLLRLIPLLALAIGGTARADFIAPMRSSSPISAVAANGKYNVVLTPDGEVSLYSGPKPGAAPLWSVEMPRELIPTRALVADDGRYVAVINEEGEWMVALLLGPRGEQIASYSLRQLLARHELVRISGSTSRAFWSAGKHRIDSAADRLVLNVAFAGAKPFTLSGTRAIEIELSTGKVLNRSPEVTAPVAELVTRLRGATDDRQLESLRVQLVESKDASANPALIALVRDRTANLDARVEAMKALVELATDEQLLDLAQTMGDEPQVDDALLTAISRRKLKAAEPHVQRMQRESSNSNVQRKAASVLAALNPPPDPNKRDIRELLTSTHTRDHYRAIRQLTPEVLPEHLEQVLRLCAQVDRRVRSEIHRVLIRYLNPRKPDRDAFDRLVKIATEQPTLAANAPMVVILLARMADLQGDTARAEALLRVAQKARALEKDPGPATATAMLASLQLRDGRRSEALRTLRRLERMNGQMGCAPEDELLHVARFEGHCRSMPARQLADRLRAASRAPVSLTAIIEPDDERLVLVTRLTNTSRGALEIVQLRETGLVVSADGVLCPLMIRPIISRSRPAPSQLAPGEVLESAVDMGRCGGPNARVRLERQYDVTVRDASGTEWSAPLTAVAWASAS